MTFVLVGLATNRVHEPIGLPIGRYTHPTLCQCTGMKQVITFIRLGGDRMTSTAVGTAGIGLYIEELNPADAYEPHGSVTKVGALPRASKGLPN